MTGVPGGDVTLHVAITAELARHHDWGRTGGWVTCLGEHPAVGLTRCEWKARGGGNDGLVYASHLAERVLAVLADWLPHTPPDQLATLIGGTGTHGFTLRYSPPAAPEPQCTCYFTPRVLAPPCPRHPAAPEPRQDT